MVGLTTKNCDHQNKQFFADHCNNFIHSFMIFIAKVFLEKNVAVSAVVCMGLEAVLYPGLIYGKEGSKNITQTNDKVS